MIGHPCYCRNCGETFDLTGVEVISRYADCDLFKAPCCGAECDTRSRWGGPSWARGGYDDIRGYQREEGERYPQNPYGWAAR